MTEQEYNNAEGIRRSDLWKIYDSPEKFKWFLEHPVEQTPAMAFGSACHKMMLEPDSFGEEYAVAPDVNRRTNAGKAEWDAFCAENEGKTIISQEDASTIKEMEDAIAQTALPYYMLHGANGMSEVPYFWTDPETNEKCKIKCDRVCEDDNGKLYVVDYKTAVSAQTEKFNRSIFGYGYALQAAMYTEGLRMARKLDYRPEFVFVVQEKKAPYSVNVIKVTPEVMEYGDKQFHSLMDKYHTCKELDEWPGYLPVDGSVNFTDLPAWVDMDEEEE